MTKDASGDSRAVVPTKSDFVPISIFKAKSAGADLIGSRSLAPQDNGYALVARNGDAIYINSMPT